MDYREYGKTGTNLSVIGFGAIVLIGEEPAQAARIISESIEHGINYFDVAPSYGEAQGTPGIAEVLLGPALKPYRSNAFLACKTTERTARGAEIEFTRSLKRLETDYFDLYQLHAVTDVQEDIDAAFASGGVMEYLIRRKEEGQIRFLGFSAHSEEAAHAAMERYDFDSVLFPLNYGAYMQGGFGSRILNEAAEKGVARLALKAMARQMWQEGDTRIDHSKCWYEPLEDPDMMRKAMTWTLSQPITAMLPPGEIMQYRYAVQVIEEGLRPLSEEDLAILKADARSLSPIFSSTP